MVLTALVEGWSDAVSFRLDTTQRSCLGYQVCLHNSLVRFTSYCLVGCSDDPYLPSDHCIPTGRSAIAPQKQKTRGCILVCMTCHYPRCSDQTQHQ